MRKRCRLHLLVFTSLFKVFLLPETSPDSESWFGDRIPCCPLCYSLPCRNHGRPIIKHTRGRYSGPSLIYLICFMVDLAGVEPASRTLFSLLLTAITSIITALRFVCQVVEVDSNPPRPIRQPLWHLECHPGFRSHCNRVRKYF